MRNGQAMIIDALLFLMICGSSAAILAWASSVYGNEALDAYRNLYMIDVESSVIQVLGRTSYQYEGNEMFWMDQFGRYLEGQFNETDPRFKLLLDQWKEVCNVSGNPLMVEIMPEGKTSICAGKVCAGRYPGNKNVLILSCPIEDRKSSTFESVLNYTTCGGIKPALKDCTGTCNYVDIGARAGKGYAHMLFLEVEKPDNGACKGGIRPEPPYYASPKLAKTCHSLICDMFAKIYY